MHAESAWLQPLLIPRTVRRRDADCTGAIRAVLSTGESFTLRELHEETGRRWSRKEMASVLTKLTRRKAVEVIQAVPGKRWGRLYREKQNHDG